MKIRSTTSKELAKILNIPESRALEAKFKADIISGIKKIVASKNIQHATIAKRSGVPRSSVTGILSCSLQSITIDRLLRIVQACGMTAEVRLKKVA